MTPAPRPSDGLAGDARIALTPRPTTSSPSILYSILCSILYSLSNLDHNKNLRAKQTSFGMQTKGKALFTEIKVRSNEERCAF